MLVVVSYERTSRKGKKIMKWLVLWTMMQLVPVGCKQEPDPYGRASMMTLTVACWDQIKHDGRKAFYTFEEAFAFMENGELNCSECSQWELRRQE